MTDTQLESWEQVQLRLPEQKAVVLGEIRRNGKMALFQAALSLKVPDHWISGAITRLKDEGFLVDSGERIVNPKSGRNVILWTTPAEPPKRVVEHDRIKCSYCNGKGYVEQARLF